MNDSGRRSVILFAHGARDSHWSGTLERLAEEVRRRLPEATVLPAYLEFQSPTLEDALAAAFAAGCRRIDVLPVFWSGVGGHVANELPLLLQAFCAAHPEVTVRRLPVLSELPGMIEFIAAAISTR